MSESCAARRDVTAEVAELAGRLGASVMAGFSEVRLTQRGTMRAAEGQRWMRFTANQSIRISECAFEWRARTGPLGAVHIVDALRSTGAELGVKLLGLVPLGQPEQGPKLLLGELIRYLAELPYAPDAIRANRALRWSWHNDAVLSVSADSPAGVAEVMFGMDRAGRIGTVRALRPRLEDGVFVERPWHGRFYDYRRCAERWIPFVAEAAWVVDGAEHLVWRGELTGWSTEQAHGGQ